MSDPTPRLRMFAGPNGSGKSTIKDNLPLAWLGVYVNADDIEKLIRINGFLPLSQFEIEASASELADFFSQSTFLQSQGLSAAARRITLDGDKVVFNDVTVNSYYASVLADFIRHKLLRNKVSFTFETVMSSPDKVDFMRKARSAGFRTYLYFVATEDPEINVSRVNYRVQMGGHDVATDKIKSRYGRSLNLLSEAIACADRAYVFDNSGDERVWVAEVTDGNELEMKTDLMPYWFKAAVWDKFSENGL